MTSEQQRGEDRLIDWLRRQPGTNGIGDDAALLADASGTILATVDSQIAGVHVPADLDAGLLARRLLHVNLSDLAAMGAPPAALRAAPEGPAWCHALVAVAASGDFDHRHFFSVLLAECAGTRVALAGGDLATSPRLSVTMTLIARRPSGWQAVHRGAAHPGDVLWVGGTLGESGAGFRLLGRGARQTAHGERAHVFLPNELRADDAVADAARRAVRRHLEPTAQLDLGAWLGERAQSDRVAGLDLSDGLGRDLPRLARESGVGVEVDSAALPLADGFGALCETLAQDPIDLALESGEDYVILFTLPPDVEPPERLGCRPIGRVVEGNELSLLRGGHREPWPVVGWDHLERG